MDEDERILSDGNAGFETWIEAANRLGARGACDTLLKILLTGAEAKQREAAAYGLTFAIGRHDKAKVTEAFCSTLDNRAEEISVRAQAAEGLAEWHEFGKKSSPVFKQALESLLRGLHDDSPEVRFWCAFGLGKLRSREALPALEKVALQDKAVLPGWWAVADEAADAITIIKGGSPPDRERNLFRGDA